MNFPIRRLATVTAGVALAASAVAVTGSAAFAGTPEGGSQPLSISVYTSATDTALGTNMFEVEYSAPVNASSVQSVTCSVDNVPSDQCGGLIGSGSATYGQLYMFSDFAGGEHTFSYTVTTSKVTYSGSVQITGTGA